jgi:hypothetical protein
VPQDRISLLYHRQNYAKEWQHTWVATSMAPEAPGNLVVLEIEQKNLKFECLAHRFDPVKWKDPTIIHASFAAIGGLPGYEPVAHGAVYVDRAGYEARTYSADVSKGRRGRFYWRHPVHRNGLMMVVVLPQGHALPTVYDADPVITECKVFDGRMVLHWDVFDDKKHRAEFSWRMEPVQSGTELEAHCASLNEEAAHLRKQPPQVPAPSFPSWAPIAGAVSGGITLIFFMVVAVLTLLGHGIPASGRFPFIAALALGAALASAFLGGDAVAHGYLPIPFVKGKPIQFSVLGGIAVFVIVLLIGNTISR